MGSRRLGRQLDAFRAGFMARLPADERRAVLDATAGLVVGRGLAVGEPAPDFALPDQHGRVVRLAERLAHGPVVLLFVRGGWCPFCTLTLRAYQEALPAIEAAGAELLGLTPQPADTVAVVAERDLLAFAMLSDGQAGVAAQYGGTYQLPEPIRRVYARIGHDLPQLNGTRDWRLPFPATYVIGVDGRVTAAEVGRSETCRLEPGEVVRVLGA